MLQFYSIVKFTHLYLLLAGSFSKRETNHVHKNTSIKSNDDYIFDRTIPCHHRESNDPTTTTTTTTTTTRQSPTCKRISSYDAALLIRNAYMKHNLPNNHPSDDTLLLITSDASRGANRYSGLAAILREVPYDTNQEKDSTNVTTWDRVTIATRRMHSQNARDISKLEVAAVAMGIRTAIKYVPPDRRRTVLILTDSSSALNFFCRNNDISLDNNHTSLTLLNDPHYKAMQMMLQENIDQEKENVTSRILMAKVKSNKFENEGFFDHDATDIISSAIKNKSNRQASEIYSWGNEEHANPSMMGDSFQKKIMDDLTTRRLLVPSLQSQDIDFLALSETKFEIKVKKPQVVVKRERGERLERSKQRIKDELGINIF